LTRPARLLVLKLSRLPSGRPEVFASIQGEGPTRGLPSVFVRLALCNLRCVWCDTKYTWDWEHYDRRAEIVELEPDAVAKDVQAFGHRNVVITGGEPLLQQRALSPLVSALKKAGRRIEVETNGTLCPVPALAETVDQWNVSPKLANSGNSVRLRTVASAVTLLAAQPNAYFKFVVSYPSEIEEVQQIVVDRGIQVERVIVMPEAEDIVTLAERARSLVPACRAAGFGFSTRLQVTLWGGTRGR